jgi:ubiquinone biosynthesis protein
MIAALLRLNQIRRTFKAQGLAELIPSQNFGLAKRLLIRLCLGSRQGNSASGGRGERLRVALETLGPVFIKFGQALSTRRDMLPEDIADELAKLQDQVPPFESELAKQRIESALGHPVEVLFASFSDEPLASASVAQVHRARLHSGESVVVKVIRPDIKACILQDTAWMAWIAGWIERLHPQAHRLRPQAIVSDYTVTILDELDLAREAANASQLRRNFEHSEQLYVPKVYWDYTTSTVYTMEEVSGIPVNDKATLESLKVNCQCLAERGVEIFFTQVLRDSFFHADMHPGNILIDAKDPERPSYIALDCAIIGSLSEADQYYLARNLLGIFQRDYRLVAQLHIECGWVPKETRVQDFESAIRTVCEPVFEKPIAELSFAQLLMNLFQTAARFDMPIQPSLVLLQKTLLNIEGLGRELYPQLNLWDTAKPFIEQWMAERYSVPNTLKRLQEEAPGLLEALPKIPTHLLDRLLTQAYQDPIQKPQTNGGMRHGYFWVSWLAGAGSIALVIHQYPLTGVAVALGSWLLIVQNSGR